MNTDDLIKQMETEQGIDPSRADASKRNDHAKPTITSLIGLLTDDQVSIFWLPMAPTSGSGNWSNFGHSVIATNKHVMSLYIDLSNDGKVFFKDADTEMGKMDHYFTKGDQRFVVLKHQDVNEINQRIDELLELARKEELKYLDPRRVGTRVSWNRAVGGAFQFYRDKSKALAFLAPVATVAPMFLLSTPVAPLIGLGAGIGVTAAAILPIHLEAWMGYPFDQDLPGQNCATAVRYVLDLYNGYTTDYCLPSQLVEMHENSRQLVLTGDSLRSVTTNEALAKILATASSSTPEEVCREGWHRRYLGMRGHDLKKLRLAQ